MKAKILLSITVIHTVILLSGCQKERFDPEVNFPAAYIVNGEDNSISVIDLADNEVKASLALKKSSWPHHISLSPDKTMLAIGVPGVDLSEGHGGHAGMSSGLVVIADANTGEILERIKLSGMNHNAIFSPDGSEIWTSQMEMEGKVYVFDTKKFKEKTKTNVGSMPAEITFSHDGTTAFVANSGSNTVTAISVTDKSILATIPVGENPIGAWKASNNKMYVDNEDGKSISVIDVATLAVEETINLGFTPAMAAYNAIFDELWVTDTDNGAVVYFKKISGAWTNAGSISTAPGAHAIAFTNNENIAYVTNQMAGTVSVIDVNAKAKIRDVTVGKKPNGILLKY